MTAAAFWQAAHIESGERFARQIDDNAEEAFWRDHAPGYDAKSPLAACATQLIRDLLTDVERDWHLLEIGAGPGAFTRRLAPQLSRITVIEPSAAMRAEFERLWDGPDMVQTMGCKWEDAPEIEADVVFVQQRPVAPQLHIIRAERRTAIPRYKSRRVVAVGAIRPRLHERQPG